LIAYIEGHRDQFGVEPICTTLREAGVSIAPSTFYDAQHPTRCARSVRDETLKVEIARVHRDNFSVYGVHKVWLQPHRENIPVARCTVQRLMRELHLAGVVRGKAVRTTISSSLLDRPEDLVERQFHAPAPNQLWVADLTYVRTVTGFVYCAFMMDVFSRRIVGWRLSKSLRTDLALDALAGVVAARPGRPRRPRPGPPQRPRSAVPRHPLRRTPRRSGRCHQRREQGGQLRHSRQHDDRGRRNTGLTRATTGGPGGRDPSYDWRAFPANALICRPAFRRPLPEPRAGVVTR
jgi:Integrase core domain/HTH-like domain